MEEKYHVLDLPSKLKPYDKNKVKEVSVRFLKGKDEKLIGEISLDNFDKKYSLLLDQVLKGIDPRELTLGDRTYIAVWLSMNCYSTIYPIPVTCDYCAKRVEIDIDLTKLEKIELSDSFSEPTPVNLMDGTIVNLRLLRVRDNISYVDYVRNKKEDEPSFKLALSMCDERNMIDRIQYLNSLSVKDLNLLRDFHNKNIHGVNLESYSYTCPKCKEVGETPVPFRFELLFPDSSTVAKFARSNV
jgi:hypothetical protein